MARKQQSEFSKRIQGTAYETLKNDRVRKTIEGVVKVMVDEFPDFDTQETLCSIRDHVNALIGASLDIDQAHRESVMRRASSGEFKDNPQGAIDLLHSQPEITIAAVYAEVDRQGIPDL